jgi:hypothetical protein
MAAGLPMARKAPPLGGAHDGQHRAGQVNGRAQIHGEHLVPSLVRRLFNAETTGETTDQMNGGVNAAVQQNGVTDQLLHRGEVFERHGHMSQRGVLRALRARHPINPYHASAGVKKRFRHGDA